MQYMVCYFQHTSVTERAYNGQCERTSMWSTWMVVSCRISNRFGPNPWAQSPAESHPSGSRWVCPEYFYVSPGEECTLVSLGGADDAAFLTAVHAYAPSCKVIPNCYMSLCSFAGQAFSYVSTCCRCTCLTVSFRMTLQAPTTNLGVSAPKMRLSTGRSTRRMLPLSSKLVLTTYICFQST
jgi:hypothetical protein